MSALPLSQLRLQPPRIASDVIQRHRLFTAIDDGLARPLLVVIAPAGFGKTTLLVSWAQASGREVAWLTLSLAENSRGDFYRAFIHAVERVRPAFGQSIRALLDLPEIPSSAYLAEAVAEELRGVADELAIVLDEYEHIESADVDDFVVRLAEYAGPQLALILASRTEPLFPMAFLRSRAQVAELRPNDLQFDRGEALRFMEAALPSRLSEEAIDDLIERAAGWPAALRIIASLRSPGTADAQPGPDVRPDGWPGTWSEDGLHQVLLNEVVLQQSQAVRDFLLDTAVPERWSVPLREALSEKDLQPGESAQALREIVRSRLFIHALDSRGEWYEYHSLLRGALLEYLRSTRDEAAIREMHRRAAIWFSEHHAVAEAVSHAVQAEDEQTIVDVVDAHARELLDTENAAMLERLLESLPYGLVNRHASLLLARCWAMTVRMSFATIEQALTRAEALPDFRVDRAAEVDALRAVVAFSHADYEQARDLAWSAIAPGDLFVHGLKVSWTIWGLSSHVLGAGSTAIAYFSARIGTIPLGFEEEACQIDALNNLAGLHLLEGNLDAVNHLARMAVARASSQNLSVAESWAHYLLAKAYLLRNDLTAAAAEFRGSLNGGLRTNAFVLRESYLGLAFCQQALGDTVSSRATLEAARKLGDETPGLDSNGAIVSMDGRLSLLRGEAPRPRLLGPSPGQSFFERTSICIETPAETGIWLSLMADDSRPARRITERRSSDLVEQFEQVQDCPGLVAALVLHACVLTSIDKMTDALNALARAISLASPGGILQPFVEHLLSVAPLLPRLTTGRPDERAFRSRLLDRLPETKRATEPLGTPDWPAVELTWREVEVLELLSKHLTNKEMAIVLNISPETVKSHVARLCRKLGVSNRRAVVARSRTLGLTRS